MTRVNLESDLKSKLLTANEPVEVCDAAGKVIGVFTPKIDLAAFEREDPVDYAELERRLREDEFISTEEAIARLGLE